MRGPVTFGRAGSARLVEALRGSARRVLQGSVLDGCEWFGRVRQVRYSAALFGKMLSGKAGVERHHRARSSSVRQVWFGQSIRGQAR